MNKKSQIILTVFIIIGFTIGFIYLSKKKHKDEFIQVIDALVERNLGEPGTVDGLILLKDAYTQDNFSDVTFDKYPVSVYEGPLSMLNIEEAPKRIKEFRTVINEYLKTAEVDFGGKYTLVYIPLTGWNGNYVLVDRETGASQIIPYEMLNISTRPDSYLIKINPKEYFNTSCLSPDSEFGCVSNYELDMRPYYYFWNGVELEQIGNPAPDTKFWSR